MRQHTYIERRECNVPSARTQGDVNKQIYAVGRIAPELQGRVNIGRVVEAMIHTLWMCPGRNVTTSPFFARCSLPSTTYPMVPSS